MGNASTRHHSGRVRSAGARGADIRTKPSDYRQRYFALIAQDFLLSGAVHFLTGVGLPRSGIARKLRAFAEAVEGGSNALTMNSEDLELFAKVCGIAHDWTRNPEFTGRD